MWCVILTASIAFAGECRVAPAEAMNACKHRTRHLYLGMLCRSSAAHSASALRCKCGSHRVEAQNSTTFAPMPVTVIPLAECKGSPFCYTAGRGGACYFRMEGEPRDYSYTVVFGCLSYQQNRQLCPWEGRKKKHDCCHYDDCNELNGELVIHHAPIITPV